VRPKRDTSPTCISQFSPYGVSRKEACKDTPELILDRNMDRQRAKGIAVLTIRIGELMGPAVGLEVAIIRLISQIPMLVWLRTMTEL
jgi:hypothetical protein